MQRFFHRVTAIADNALSGYGKLTTVTIPSTVTKIGKNAFANIAKKPVIAVPKSKKSAYKKLLTKQDIRKL